MKRAGDLFVDSVLVALRLPVCKERHQGLGGGRIPTVYAEKNALFVLRLGSFLEWAGHGRKDSPQFHYRHHR